jgi:rSAM/selenodomain-associated transferase 1
VIAKTPLPGRAKTRLSPPLSLEEAATLAEAALADTLAAAGAAATGGRRVLALDGRPGPWLPAGWEVLHQRGDGLGERLANAFADAGGPALLVGMDTPQLTPALLGASAAALRAPGVDAVLGPAADGGYWAIGLRRPDAAVFLGVPMSSPTTLAAQRRRLRALGYRWLELPELRDVDTYPDALAVASAAPSSRFARSLGGVRGALAVGGAHR